MANRKTPVRFTVDFTKRQIIGTGTSLKKAQHPGSPEYADLCKLIAEHPQFTVARKEVGQSASKQTYKNLSFAFIEKYISIQPEADAIKREYEQVKKDAENLKLGVYPYTKSWFLKKFSGEDKSFDMDTAREEIINVGLAATQVEAAE